MNKFHILVALALILSILFVLTIPPDSGLDSIQRLFKFLAVWLAGMNLGVIVVRAVVRR